MSGRSCGDCQLCCRLLPVRSPLLDKNANEKCRFQKFHVGCTVYGSRSMPGECTLWSCRWLIGTDTSDISRPVRTHYVIDVMPDFVEASDGNGREMNIEVVQVWVDPKYREAWRDPALLAYLTRRGEEMKAALIRYSAQEAFVLLPPTMSPDGKFLNMSDHGKSSGRTHSFTEIVRALS